MKMYNIFKYKKTNFLAGGAKSNDFVDIKKFLKIPKGYLPPRKIDCRDLCLKSSQQGPHPFCVGYAVAGCIEVSKWRFGGKLEQVNGAKIYSEAKIIDNHPNDEGTTLFAGVQAAIVLGHIPNEWEYVYTKEMLKRALHVFGTFPATFNIDDDWNYVDRSTGMIRNNKNTNKIGGHCVLCCGFSDDGLYIQNSWGQEWGHYGFAILPWDKFDEQFTGGIAFWGIKP
jgi:hypothetical protein